MKHKSELFEKIKEHQQAWARKFNVHFDNKGYVINLDDNLYQPLKGEVLEQFKAGDGNELRCKMRALHSSSALAVNSFLPWLYNSALSFLSLDRFHGFQNIIFEAKLNTGASNRRANLDLLCWNDNTYVGIESKFGEILGSKKKDLSDKYAKPRALDSLLKPIRKEIVKFEYLDAAQLVKHFLGLRNMAEEKNSKGLKFVLMYLFWEPENWRRFEEYKEHRNEIKQFRRDVIAKLNAQKGKQKVQFVSKGCFELWKDWQKPTQKKWQKKHMKYLLDRYCFKL